MNSGTDMLTSVVTLTLPDAGEFECEADLLFDGESKLIRPFKINIIGETELITQLFISDLTWLIHFGVNRSSLIH